MRNGLAQRDRFIEATIRKVAELGLENLRTKHIAAEVDMSEATMFLYFSNKEGILRETFFEVDRRLSNILLKSPYLVYNIVDEPNFEELVHKLWHDVYRYLIDNSAQTMFTVRYRYSAYYTPEIRARRQAFNGAFDRVYAALKQRFNETAHFYEGFLVNYVFELTLSFAEKVINGYINDSPETEKLIWNGIRNTVRGLMRIEDEENDG